LITLWRQLKGISTKPILLALNALAIEILREAGEHWPRFSLFVVGLMKFQKPCQVKTGLNAERDRQK